MLATIPMELIEDGQRLRGVSESAVEALVQSIADVGLLNPITVYPRKLYRGGAQVDGYGLVAGLHRKTACARLGLAEIEANIVSLSDLECQIAECDENLCANQLTPADRARFTRRRKEAYEALHPETRHGVAGARASNAAQGNATDNLSTASYAQDQAAKTGVDPRTVRRDAERGAKIDDTVLDALRGTDLDTGAYLDKLKRVPMPEQAEQVRRDMGRVPGGARSIMASRVAVPEDLDFFPTPPWATRALCEDVLGHLGLSLADAMVWEPACGEGHISGVLAEYAGLVCGTDIFDYSVDGRAPPHWLKRLDFLNDAPLQAYDWIITNPPFGDRALPFIHRALAAAGTGVAMFVRSQWAVEGVERFNELFRDNPPTLCAFFVERVNLCAGRWDPEGSTATAYCWLVWVKGRAPLPPFWIPPGRKGERSRPNDVERFTARPVAPMSPALRQPLDEQRAGDAMLAVAMGHRALGSSPRVTPPEDDGGEGGVSAQPFRSTPETDAVIRRHYAGGSVDFAALCAELGCTKLQARRRANQLGLGNRDRQAAAVAQLGRDDSGKFLTGGL